MCSKCIYAFRLFLSVVSHFDHTIITSSDKPIIIFEYYYSSNFIFMSSFYFFANFEALTFILAINNLLIQLLYLLILPLPPFNFFILLFFLFDLN